MIYKLFHSEFNQDIDEIINWFNMCRKAIYDYKNNIISGIEKGVRFNLSQEVSGLTLNELDNYFEDMYKELENVTCLSLLAAVEAKLRTDYLFRSHNKKKDALSKKFRYIYKQKSNKASLEEDILNAWTEIYPELKRIIGDYKGALNYRNWLAHGRYWEPTLGRKYDVNIVYSISDNIVRNITII